MRNHLIALLLAVVLAPRAAAVQSPTTQDAGNANVSAAFVPNLDFLSCLPFRVEASTAPKLIGSGPGVLYELTETSGTASSAYTVANDTDAVYDANGAKTTTKDYALGLLVGGTAVGNIKAGYAITPRIFTDNGGTGAANTVGSQGRFAPARGRRFLKGLVVANSDIGADTGGCYRLDAWNIVTPPTK